MNEKRENVLLVKFFAFAIKVVKLYQCLIEVNREYVLSKQLLRSGTAVGALIREAQNAESKADFIHKLAIAQKECDESIYWLELLQETNYLSLEIFTNTKLDANELLKIIRSSILTTRKNMH